MADWMPLAAIQTNFGNLDWVIVAVYLLGSIVVGVYANRYIGNLADYLVAGRGLGVYLCVATMTGTELGLVTVMYNAEEGFMRGFSAFTIGVIACCTSLTIGFTGVVVSRLREEGVMTIPEYYERKFGPKVRWIGGIMLTVACVLNFALFLRVGADFITYATGLEATHLKLVMSVMLILVLFYTALGGMVSVVITDYVQFIMITLGLGIAVVFALRTVGWGNMVDTVLKYKEKGGFNPLLTPGYGWSFVFWMVFLNMASQIAWLPSTLRALAAKSPVVARRLYLGSGISFLARCVLPMLLGIAAFTYIQQDPELRQAFFPAYGEPVCQAKHAMPILLARIIPSGLLGLLTAGMMAAFMSTHDSYFLAFASVVTQDVVNPCVRGGLSERTRIWLTRIIILLMGAFLLWWGLWYEPPESIWKYMAATGTIYLPGALACLVGGMYWKKASSTGAALAILAGLFGLAGVVNWERHGLGWITQNGVAVTTIALSASAMIFGSLLFPDGRRATPAESTRTLGVLGLVVIVGAVVIAGVQSEFSGTFWLAVFVITCALFAVLALIVSVLGAFDMRKLFQTIIDQHEASSLAEHTEPDAAPKEIGSS